MADDDKENFFGILETRGEPWVRAQLETHQWGTRTPLVMEWLQIKGEERLTQREKQAIRTIEAAERSAAASEQSAKATKQAAQWALLSAVISLIAIIISVLKDWAAK
jgi:hypothetical protein